MKRLLHRTAMAPLISVAFILHLSLAMTQPAVAEIEHARDLMEANRFEEAYRELWPAARSGNADAEELIGVMYAMGLGVEQDYRRAFEWYLRSSMKGHPGAQSGIGWYYDLGLGMPAPDLVRVVLRLQRVHSVVCGHRWATALRPSLSRARAARRQAELSRHRTGARSIPRSEQRSAQAAGCGGRGGPRRCSSRRGERE